MGRGTAGSDFSEKSLAFLQQGHIFPARRFILCGEGALLLCFPEASEFQVNRLKDFRRYLVHDRVQQLWVSRGEQMEFGVQDFRLAVGLRKMALQAGAQLEYLRTLLRLLR